MLQMSLVFSSFFDEKLEIQEPPAPVVNEIDLIGQDVDIKKDYAIRSLIVSNIENFKSVLIWVIFDFRDKKRPCKVFKNLDSFKSFHYKNEDKQQYLSFDSLNKAYRFLDRINNLEVWVSI